MKQEIIKLVVGAVLSALVPRFVTGITARILIACILVLTFYFIVTNICKKRLIPKTVATGIVIVIALMVALAPYASIAIQVVEIVDGYRKCLTDFDVFIFDSRNPGIAFLTERLGDHFEKTDLYEREYYAIAISKEKSSYIESKFRATENKGADCCRLLTHWEKPILFHFQPIYFSLYSSEVDLEHQVFKNISDFCHDHPGIRLVVMGHADTKGKPSDNQKEAMNRALAVKREILQRTLLKDVDVLCVSCGEQRLQLNTKDNVAEKMNRCVCIYAIESSAEYRCFNENRSIFGQKKEKKQKEKLYGTELATLECPPATEATR